MILALLISNIAFLAIFGTHAQQESRATTEEGNESAAQQARKSERESAPERTRARGGRVGVFIARASGVWMRAQFHREAYKTDGDLNLLSNERLWVVF
jgi:hypothetical protein